MGAANWQQLQGGLIEWVASVTGLPESQIIFLDQGGNLPEYPYVTVKIVSRKRVGQFDSMVKSGSGSGTTYSTQGMRDVAVQVECWAETSLGNESACAYLDKLENALASQVKRQALRVKGWSHYNSGTVLDLAQLFGPEFVGRASLDLSLYVMSGDSDTIGIIETIEGESNLSGVVEPFSVTPEGD